MPRRSGMAAVALAYLAVIAASAQTVSQDHPGQYTQQEIDTGARLYSTQCATCHGPNGDQVSGVDLRRGQFRRAVSDEDLTQVIRSGTPGGMPPFMLSATELTGVLAFIRAGFDVTGEAVKVGDPARGKVLFEGKGACGTCHRVRGQGPRLAPDLSDIGAARSPSALQRSLRDPSSAMVPINRPVRIVMRDGRAITGRRLNEDTYTVQLIDDKEHLLSVAKGDIKSMDVATVSPMPSYNTTLTIDEQADLVAYLLSLREP